MDFKLNPTGSKHGAHPLLGERLKDWVAQLLKALSSGSGVGWGGKGEIKVEKILI